VPTVATQYRPGDDDDFDRLYRDSYPRILRTLIWLPIPGAIGRALLPAGLVLCAVTASICVISLRGYNPVSDLIIPAGGVALLLASALVATVSGVRGLMALRPVSAA